MRKNYNQEEAQQKCHQVSEPVLSPRLDDAETMSIEDARAMTLAAVREEYAQL